MLHDEQLGQTGGGHFSPIGAYNSEHDKVCKVHTIQYNYLYATMHGVHQSE
jgi:Phytochelatin synthase